MLKVTVTENHIHHAKWASWHRPDDDRRDAIIAAFQDAGIDDVKLEIHLNLIPPNHQWGIWINGKRYAMTIALVRYYDDFRIHNGHRTDNAIITLDPDTMTADVRLLPPDTRPEWEKRGMTYHEYREKVVLGGEPVKPLTPLWMQQDGFPDWLKAKRIIPPWEAELEAIKAKAKKD